MAKETDVTVLHDTIASIVSYYEMAVKDYIPQDDLVMWAVAAYEKYDARKVITWRFTNQCDFSVILSDTRISVIDNTKGHQSWCACIDVIAYADLEQDILNLFMAFDVALVRTQV